MRGLKEQELSRRWLMIDVSRRVRTPFAVSLERHIIRRCPEPLHQDA